MSFQLFGKEQELLQAARNGKLEDVAKLLNTKSRKSMVPGAFGQKLTSFLKSVNVNCTDKNGYTPLHHAAVNGHRDVVEALLKADAQPGLKDNQGCTPVHLAAWSGEPEIVHQLLEVGSESDAAASPITPVHVNQQNNSGDTALHCAAQYGHVAVVQVLLQKQANPTIRNLTEASPLDFAAQYGHLAVVQVILISHPDLPERPLFNHSPLHLAASNGHKEIVAVLLDNGFSIHTVTEAGTALHEAALHGKLDVVRLLLERGVDLDARDQKGQTVMELLSEHQAQQKSFTDVVKAIKDHEARKNQSAGVYETLANCNSGKPTAAVRPLPPEKPVKPEKPMTPDKPVTESPKSPKSPNRPTPTPRNSTIKLSPEPTRAAGQDYAYATPVKDKHEVEERAGSHASNAGDKPAPPPLPPRSSVFPPEDHTAVSLPLDSSKMSPEPSPKSTLGVPKKPARRKPPRSNTGSPVGLSTSPKAEYTPPTTDNSITPPPAAHKPDAPFPDLYSTIDAPTADQTQDKKPYENEPPEHSKACDSDEKPDPPFPDLYSTISVPSSDQVKDQKHYQNEPSEHSKSCDDDCSNSIPKPDQDHGPESHSNNSHSQPATSPKPALPSRTQSAKLDNSIDPVTGRQVSQEFYMEMKAVEVKPRPVSEVKPQRQSDNAVSSTDDSKDDHYGILYPNFRKDSPTKSKKPELRRTHTAPEETDYIIPSPKTAVDKFKDKHGLMRRANSAPEESEYTTMTGLNVEQTEVKENEYAEIPDGNKNDAGPRSPKDNVYEVISETKSNIEMNMLSQLSEFSSGVSQGQNKGGNSPTAGAGPNQKKESATVSASGKPPTNLAFSERKTNSSTPLTPTGYAQPPTPDFPPPSPATAMMGIELKIQEMDSKRKSRDITTITDDSLDSFAGQGQDLGSRSDEGEEAKISISEKRTRSRSRSGSHGREPTVITEAVVEETEAEANGDFSKTADANKEKETTGASTKPAVVTVIKSEVTKGIPESSIPDISVIKTESRVSLGDKSEFVEAVSEDTEDSEMFRKRNQSKGNESDKDKAGQDKSKHEDEDAKPALPPKKGDKPSVKSKPSPERPVKPVRSKQSPEKPLVKSKPSAQVVEKVKNETKDTAVVIAESKELTKVREDGKPASDDVKGLAEGNSAVPKDSPVMMRKKSEVDMFAGLKRGSTIGVPPKARSTYHEVLLQNVAGYRESLHQQLALQAQQNQGTGGAGKIPVAVSSKPGGAGGMEQEDDIDFDQVMASIDSEVARAPVNTDSMSFDDAEEWAKIQDIMASFGGGVARESVFVKDLEPAFIKLLAGSAQMQSVGEWLESIGMAQYENQFITNGFDNLDFLGPKILEEQDLEQIKVLNYEHRKKILQSAKELPHLPQIDPSHPPSSVEEWLSSLQLAGYLETFTCHGYDTMEKVQSILWDLQLRTVLDISMLGHRKRILGSLGDRSPDKVNNKGTSLGSLSLDKSRSHLGDLQFYRDYTSVKSVSSSEEDIKESMTIANKRPSLSSLSPDKSRSHLGDLDFYRDYTSVKPVSSSEEDIKETMAIASSEEEEEVFKSDHSRMWLLRDKKGSLKIPEFHVDMPVPSGQTIRDSSIHVRPPHLAQTSSPAKQWRHRPEMLIKGCCNYTAQYLGSTIVPELTGGTESTRAGITKLKKSTDSLAKVPIIMLSISYKGVKFIDAKSKKVICDHDISNIFCACQDTEHLNFFAYITRDIESSHHYCHVFSVKSASLAHDIILTLGESFEVAYQIAIKEKSRQDAMQLDRQLSQSETEVDTYSVSSKISTNTV